MAIKISEIIDALGNMKAIELNELATAIQEKFGISAMPTMGGGGGAAAEEATGSGFFDVKLIDAGATKMDVLKFIKEKAGTSLADTKAYVDAPGGKGIGALYATGAHKYSKADAEALAKELTDKGAKVEVFAI